MLPNLEPAQNLSDVTKNWNPSVYNFRHAV